MKSKNFTFTIQGAETGVDFTDVMLGDRYTHITVLGGSFRQSATAGLNIVCPQLLNPSNRQFLFSCPNNASVNFKTTYELTSELPASIGILSFSFVDYDYATLTTGTDALITFTIKFWKD